MKCQSPQNPSCSESCAQEQEQNQLWKGRSLSRRPSFLFSLASCCHEGNDVYPAPVVSMCNLGQFPGSQPV